jgi:branched-chain amino acid transport system ATP-binding protein
MHAKSGLLKTAMHLNYREEIQMRKEAMELLEMQNLAAYRNDIASSLPYGQQRHLEIARALATNPTLLLLDEPAAGMNPQETDELAAFIKKRKRILI